MKNKITSAFLLVSITLFLAACQEDDFKLSKNTNDLFHVKNGDYAIPVLVRGNTAGKKIILYIQGGPGYSSLDFARVDYPGWKNSLEVDYAVAYYDQRGMGNIQGNFTQGPNTLSTWINDLNSVARFLQKAYGAEIVMLGHSFGGDLMYRYMVQYGSAGVPVKYISVDAPVTTDSDLDTLRWDFRWHFLYNTAQLEISRGKRIAEWNEVLVWLNANPELKKVPGDNPYQLFNQWNQYVEDLIYVDYPEKLPGLSDYLNIAFTSNYNPLQYIRYGFKDKVADRILGEEENDFLMTKLSLINNQTLLVIGGRYDDICPPEELDYVFDQLGTMQKTLKIIDHAGHTPFIDQPTEFYTLVKQFIQ